MKVGAFLDKWLNTSRGFRRGNLKKDLNSDDGGEKTSQKLSIFSLPLFLEYSLEYIDIPRSIDVALHKSIKYQCYCNNSKQYFSRSPSGNSLFLYRLLILCPNNYGLA